MQNNANTIKLKKTETELKCLTKKNIKLEGEREGEEKKEDRNREETSEVVIYLTYNLNFTSLPLSVLSPSHSPPFSVYLVQIMF